MNKKTRIATIALAVFLVGMFLYQVAYGTNESSYKFGYQGGREGYACSNYEGDCDNGLSACQVGLKIGYNNGVSYTGGDVTNQTACDDKSADDSVNVNDSSNILSPLSKTCGGSIVEYSGPWKVIG